MSDYQMPPKEVNLSQPVESDEETIDLLELLYAAGKVAGNRSSA